MKVSGPILPPPATPAPSGAGAAKGQARGQFQNMIQRLESDMWAGAEAGASPAAPAAPRVPVRGGGPVAAPAKLTPASTLRDPSLPVDTETAAPKRYDIRDIVAAQAPLAASVASERARPGEPLVAFAPIQTPRARAASSSGEPAAVSRTAAPAPQLPQTHYEALAERLSLINGAGGLSVAVRVREDRPLDADLLKRMIARVLHEHGAGTAQLYINGTHATTFDGGERHGD